MFQHASKQKTENFAHHHLKVSVVNFALLLTLLSTLFASSQHRGLHFIICIIVIIIILVS